MMNKKQIIEKMMSVKSKIELLYMFSDIRDDHKLMTYYEQASKDIQELINLFNGEYKNE